MIEGQRFLEEYANYLNYYSITDLQKARKLFEKTARCILATKIPLLNRFKYLVSAKIYLNQWHKHTHRKPLDIPDVQV
ncbi:hypothetical protein ACVLD2_003247 [Paenibacillus sp. PvR052]|nr:hypothetical protein [Paenibacillus sp. PvP091]MBP1170967.1 hypothetical protein [Paenibacillus sp. PvR098]MBP2441995.1 hypothetical protein [Paenibacillus sp. PvP052]